MRDILSFVCGGWLASMVAVVANAVMMLPRAASFLLVTAPKGLAESVLVRGRLPRQKAARAVMTGSARGLPVLNPGPLVDVAERPKACGVCLPCSLGCECYYLRKW